MSGAEAVVLMLFGPDSVREVLAEVLQHVQPGTLVIDATTVNLASLATDAAARAALRD